MKKKRAKALAKLCGFNPHHPRQYFAIPTGTKRKGLFQFVAGQERRAYQDLKKQFKRGELNDTKSVPSFRVV